jgi:hypothetical protein
MICRSYKMQGMNNMKNFRVYPEFMNKFWVDRMPSLSTALHVCHTVLQLLISTSKLLHEIPIAYMFQIILNKTATL